MVLQLSGESTVLIERYMVYFLSINIKNNVDFCFRSMPYVMELN